MTLKLSVGEPDHPLGFYQTTLARRLGPQHWQRFQAWMRGQTVSFINGEYVYYTEDVHRWLDAEPIID